jgi:molybdopterin converting factor small subunit
METMDPESKAHAIRMRIKAFGPSATWLPGDIVLTQVFRNVGELRQYLLATYPALREIRFALAVNQKLADSDTLLSEDCEVAILPPFSGG